MTDKVIRVNVTSSKSQKVTVSSSKVANEITASPDTSAYYSRLAKNWAIAEGLVENIDYSSKHYAQESKASADMAKTYEISTQENYNMFMESSFNANSELQTNRDGALADIEGAKTSAIDSLNSIKDKNISTIESKANEEIENLNKEIEQGKGEIKEAIGDVKVLTTLEIGDIGIAPLGIDETKGKRRYLNGQVIIQDQYMQFTNKVKSAVALYPSLACTESEWQTTSTMTVGGQVGKFVVDDEAGTIRLPKIIMPIQGLTNLANLGEIVEAGLPNIEGFVQLLGASSTGLYMHPEGAFDAETGAAAANKQLASTSSGNPKGDLIFNASKSNPIYSNSNTVQQEQIQYPYFIQVATGAEVEDNIINEIELNNPFSLLDYKYSEYELNNLSWLRSNGQYNSKAVYPTVYDLLLRVYNGTETKVGVSVKLSTETFTDYDFVLNTTDETFRLPIKVKQKFYNAVSGNFPVVGTGIALGLTNGSGNYGLAMDKTDNHFMTADSRAYGHAVQASHLGNSNGSSVNGVYGVTTDSSKSGLIAKLSSSEVSGLYLYFYVGETVQNANLINAGRIEEKIASLIPDNSSLISEYGMTSGVMISLTPSASGTWYTAPANGIVRAFGYKNTSQNNYINIYTDKGGATGGYVPQGWGSPNLSLRVAKGEKFQVTDYNDISSARLNFYYLKSEV